MLRHLSIRVSYLLRSFFPHALPMLYFIFASLSSDDLGGILEVQWKELLSFNKEAVPSLNWFIAQLTSINAVTKAIAATTLLVIAFYLSDLFSTGRKHGWQLISRFRSTDRWENLSVWFWLTMGICIVVTTTMTLAYLGFCSSLTAYKIVMGIDLFTLMTFMFVNESFSVFQMLLPEIEDKRERKRFERQQRRNARRQQHQQREQQRLEVRQVQENIADKQRQIEAANREIRTLQESSVDTHLLEERIGNLLHQKNELNGQIKDLHESIPGRV